MELSLHKERKLGKTGNRYLHYGYSLRHFSLGFRFDKRTVDLDLCFIWIGVEW